MVHCYYQQRGGEDTSFESELAMLATHGIDVHPYTVSNEELSTLRPLTSAAATIWNRKEQTKLARLLAVEEFDVIHFQNTFPLLSPAILRTAAQSDAAVVQTMRNYRIMCANGKFYRDGGVCEDCLGKTVQFPGVLHRCYRDSAAASATVVAMNLVHRLGRTWHDHVDAVIAASKFTAEKLVQSGLPRDKVYIKPNVVMPDPGAGTGAGGQAVFVGRLVPEKGVRLILEAWRQVGGRLPLTIVGDGPLAFEVRQAAQRPGSSIAWAGELPTDDVLNIVGEASVLIFPSEWYETFGRVAIEAFAKGTPVIAADMGAMSELVDDGVTGFKFSAGDSLSLIGAVQRFLQHSANLSALRDNARMTYLQHYAPAENTRRLVEIYEKAVELSDARRLRRT